jgi:transcriptional regulator with XRE-family HTH domain
MSGRSFGTSRDPAEIRIARAIHVKIEQLEADRQHKAITVVDLARACKVNRSSLSDLFNGRRTTLSVLVKVAAYFKHDIDRYLVLPTDKTRKGTRR